MGSRPSVQTHDNGAAAALRVLRGLVTYKKYAAFGSVLRGDSPWNTFFCTFTFRFVGKGVVAGLEGRPERLKRQKDEIFKDFAQIERRVADGRAGVWDRAAKAG